MPKPGGRLILSLGGTMRVGAVSTVGVVVGALIVDSAVGVSVGSGVFVGCATVVFVAGWGVAVGRGIAVGAGVSTTSLWNSPIARQPLSTSPIRRPRSNALLCIDSLTHHLDGYSAIPAQSRPGCRD
jgi:hypothetical protein